MKGINQRLPKAVRKNQEYIFFNRKFGKSINGKDTNSSI
jgi:hypothetical protein